MLINDNQVLEMLNKYIATERLNKKQILLIIGLASISSNYEDLIDNLNWELLDNS